MTPPPVHAILWDFDNTLVDSRARNRSATRTVIAELTGRDPDRFPALRTQAAYDRAIHRTQNWQDLYRLEFGLDDERIRRAGRLWADAHRRDPTQAAWFRGIAGVVRALAGWPQAIFSLNTRDTIRAALEREGLDDAFELVVGCEEVRYDRQKPNPDGLLDCLQMLTGLVAGTAFYVGDHPIDAECAANANRALEGRGHAMRVVSVGACYGTVTGSETWRVEPHHRALTPSEILRIVHSTTDSRTHP